VRAEGIGQRSFIDQGPRPTLMRQASGFIGQGGGIHQARVLGVTGVASTT